MISNSSGHGTELRLYAFVVQENATKHEQVYLEHKPNDIEYNIKTEQVKNITNSQDLT